MPYADRVRAVPVVRDAQEGGMELADQALECLLGLAAGQIVAAELDTREVVRLDVVSQGVDQMAAILCTIIIINCSRGPFFGRFRKRFSKGKDYSNSNMDR